MEIKEFARKSILSKEELVMKKETSLVVSSNRQKFVSAKETLLSELADAVIVLGFDVAIQIFKAVGQSFSNAKERTLEAKKDDK